MRKVDSQYLRNERALSYDWCLWAETGPAFGIVGVAGA